MSLTLEPVFHRRIAVDGAELFYREAGSRQAPTLLLQHGFPSASHEFRRLIDALSGRFHVVAPDYRGFGHSESPTAASAGGSFVYSFDCLSEVVEGFVERLALRRFYACVFHFGAPVALRIASFTDAPGGLLPLVEAQGKWIAAVLGGRLRLSATNDMWAAIERAERRSRKRFPDESPDSIRCDPHAYRRLPRSDLRQARRQRLNKRLLLARRRGRTAVRASGRTRDWRPGPPRRGGQPPSRRCNCSASARAHPPYSDPQGDDYVTTLSKTYPSEDTARRAVEALRAAGVPPHDIRLLMSRPPHDIRREPRGGFAVPIGTDAPIGSYAARVRRRSQGAGSFATGSFAGDPDRQRKGSFADVERLAITVYRDAAEHSRGTGYRGVRQLLRRAALDDEAIDRAAKDLHIGHAVVLVDVAEMAPSEAQAHLEQIAQAA